MNGLPIKSRPEVRGAQTSADAEGVVLWVEKSDFTAFLEQALASARRPNLLAVSAIGTGVLLPVVLAVEQVRQNSVDFGVTAGVGAAALALAVGVTLGRWLRPAPTDKEIDAFAEKLAAAGCCTDFVEQSRQIANRLTGGAEWRQLPVSTGPCIVDHAAMIAISQVSADPARSSRSSDRKPIVVNTTFGSREFFSENVKCAECSNIVDVLHNGEGFCSVCISPLCKESQARQRQPDGTLRCPACVTPSQGVAAPRHQH